MQTFIVHVTYCGVTNTYGIEAVTGPEAVRLVRESFGPDHNPFIVLGF